MLGGVAGWRDAAADPTQLGSVLACWTRPSRLFCRARAGSRCGKQWLSGRIHQLHRADREIFAAVNVVADVVDALDELPPEPRVQGCSDERVLKLWKPVSVGTLINGELVNNFPPGVASPIIYE